MTLKAYFEANRGMGVLSTADDQGRVNSAVYARPHVQEDGTVAFIMRDRLSHHNLQSNPQAAYLFREEGPGHKGRRMQLTKIGEERDTERVKEVCRRCRMDDNPAARRYLVTFRVDEERPLIGDGEPQPV